MEPIEQIPPNETPRERLIRLRKELADAESDLMNGINSLIDQRNEKTDKQELLKEQTESIKDEVSQIDAELKMEIKGLGLDDQVNYIGGLRLEFKEEITGAIEPGCEEDFIKWAQETNNNECVKLSVGKTAFTKLIDSGVEVPSCLKTNSYKKFNVKKDTRKNK